MLEIIAIIAVVLAVAIAAVLIQPRPSRIRCWCSARSASRRRRTRIFPLINDFRQWRSWSPYEDRDPALKRTYGGADSGKGAVYAWDGNKNVGSGRMEILETSAPSKIVIKLDFFKPFEGHNTAEFTMLPQGDATQSDLDDDRARRIHVQGDAGVHESGPHDRQGFRSRSCQSEKAHREVSRTYFYRVPDAVQRVTLLRRAGTHG